MQKNHLSHQLVALIRGLCNKFNKFTTYAEEINNALHYSLKKDVNLLCFGLGVTDPKGVFGTTLNLEKNLDQKEFLISLVQKM